MLGCVIVAIVFADGKCGGDVVVYQLILFGYTSGFLLPNSDGILIMVMCCHGV